MYRWSDTREHGFYCQGDNGNDDDDEGDTDEDGNNDINRNYSLSLSFFGSLPYKDCSPEQQEDNQDCMRGRVQHVYWWHQLAVFVRSPGAWSAGT